MATLDVMHEETLGRQETGIAQDSWQDSNLQPNDYGDRWMIGRDG